MMNLYELQLEVAKQVDLFLEGRSTVKPEALGLDPRAATKLFVGDEITDNWIGVHNSELRAFEYYSGFSFIEPEYKIQMGEYTFYEVRDDTGRVQDALDYLDN